jgi:fatty-acyl-CoA synthase
MGILPGLRDLSPWWPERLAALWPGRVAVVDPDTHTRYTYEDLRDRSRSIAMCLIDSGVACGDRVATILPNGIMQIDLLFACAYIGAILAPLNWRLNPREIRDLMDDLEPRVVVAREEYADLARQMVPTSNVIISPRSQAIGLERVYDAPGFPSVRRGIRGILPRPVSMDDPWLILYTGGTTGTPKGAVLTHGSITWNSINTAISWGLSESDVGPSFTPMFHTGGWNVFTLPLLMLGGQVLLPERFDPASALALLTGVRPTVLFMVPTMFQLVAEQPEFAEADLSSLRWAISGGASLPQPVYEGWKPKVRVFKQGYGLTEVGPNNFATPDVDAVRKQGTVGRLTYFAQARIVNDVGSDVPKGQTGELLLAGPHMCAGYWRRPDATAEAIRDGWFHTGDIARCDEEGFYYIVDRKKDLIITGGENVYPAEVETVLCAHPDVREVAVVGLPDPVWGEAVAAVLSLHAGTGAGVTPDDLREFVRAHLASYKVPKFIFIVNEVPKSDAGKILRKEARTLAAEVRLTRSP